MPIVVVYWYCWTWSLFSKNRDPLFRLCLGFGVVPSTAEVWIDFGLEIMLRGVRNTRWNIFETRWPNEDEMRHSAGLVERNRNWGLLCGVYLVWRIEDVCVVLNYSDSDAQNAHCKRSQNVMRLRTCLCVTLMVRLSALGSISLGFGTTAGWLLLLCCRTKPPTQSTACIFPHNVQRIPASGRSPRW